VIWLVMVAYLVTGLVFAHLVLMNTLSEPCLAGYEADQMVSAVALALLTLVTWPLVVVGNLLYTYVKWIKRVATRRAERRELLVSAPTPIEFTNDHQQQHLLGALHDDYATGRITWNEWDYLTNEVLTNAARPPVPARVVRW